MAERWKPVPDCPGYWAEYGSGAILSPGGTVLQWQHDPDGYPTVTVYVNGRKLTKRVHRMVASAWLPKPKRGKAQVRHLDGNKDNCAAWNLKHGDQKAQEQDKRHAGRQKVPSGTRDLGLNGRERQGKEGNRTGAYRAGVTRTSRTCRS